MWTTQDAEDGKVRERRGLSQGRGKEGKREKEEGRMEGRKQARKEGREGERKGQRERRVLS